MSRVFINAGHHLHDQGTSYGSVKESELAMKIRDLVAGKLSADYVPDNLDIKQTIQWINDRADRKDMAIDIHLNSNKNASIRGVEVYYDTDLALAQSFAKQLSEKLKIPNRGAIPDSYTYFGSLGFLQQLNCPSLVIELCYLSNPEDRALITNPVFQIDAARALVEIIKYETNPTTISILQSILNKAKEAFSLVLKLWQKRNSRNS